MLDLRSNHIILSNYQIYIIPIQLSIISWLICFKQIIIMPFTETQGISKEDMCTSLSSLAKGWDGCTINSDCTCISCNVSIDQIGTVPINICIVDTCATPACFEITAGTLFSRTVCRTINIEFSIKKTVRILFFWRTVTISVSVTVEIVRRPSSGIQMTVSCLF